MSKMVTMSVPGEQPLSNESIIGDCAKLARTAEWWGAEGQGERLAKIAISLSKDDLQGAMRTRDEIKRHLDHAKSDRLFKAMCITIPFAIGGCVYLIGKYG